MIEVKLSFNTLEEATAFLCRDKASPPAVEIVNTAAEQPTPRKPRAKKEAAPEVTEQQAKDAAKIEAAAPAALRAAQPAVEALFGGAQQAPAPVEQPKATQKDLIATFRALAEAKGTAPVVEIITKYGVKSVALIPEAKWGEAVVLAQGATK